MDGITIAVDAMGGDNAPAEPVKGALDALLENSSIHVILVGREEEIRTVLEENRDKYEKVRDRLQIRNATEVIETAESPTAAIQTKKDSSLVVTLKLVKDGTCSACVSAGNSGALLVGGQVIVGRIRGVKRSPLAPVIPTEKGPAILIDCGANLDAKPENLVQFARMGSVYMEKILKVENPRVAIVNVGAEEEKGNKLVKETFPLLKAQEDINFTGSIEAREIPAGGADVIVCDAFVGNVILKLYEGTGKLFYRLLKKAFLSSARAKLGAALSLPALKKALKAYDVTTYGGAPMLGLKGLVVKTHGSAVAKEFRTSILQCVDFHEEQIDRIMEEKFS